MESTKNLREIIGYEIKSGVYESNGQSIPWENVYLHYQQDISKNGNGKKTGWLKVKRKNLPLQLDTLIYSRIVRVLKDDYDNIVQIDVED